MIRFSYSGSMRSQKMFQVTAQNFWAVTRSLIVKRTEKEIRRLQSLIDTTQDAIKRKTFDDEKKRLKARLPGFIPHALMGRNRSRDGVVHVSGMVMIDDDDEPDIDGTVEMLKLRTEELHIVYIGISISGKGLRVFFLCPEGMSIEQAQIWFSEKTGIKRDGQCIDIARFSYAVSEENIKYIDEMALFGGKLIEPWSDDVEVMTRRAGKPELRNSGTQEFRNSEAFEIPKSRDPEIPKSQDPELRSKSIKSLSLIPFDPKGKVNGVSCQKIWDEYFMRTDGKLPGPANRHIPIGRGILKMASVFDYDAPQMMSMMPRYGMSDFDLAVLVYDKLNYLKNKGKTGTTEVAEHLMKDLVSSTRDMWMESPYPSIEESTMLWRSLPLQPQWVRELLSVVPDCVKFPAFIALTPGEMVLADRVTCKYEKFRPTDLASACIVMGFSGGFKGAAMTPAEQLMSVLEQETKAELKREADYQLQREIDLTDKKKKSLVSQPPPLFNIRFLPNDTTKNRHIECLRCGRTTYTMSPELSALYESMKKPAYDRKSFFLLCFDRSMVGSQTKLGTGGVNDSQPCRWNYLCGANLSSLMRVYPEPTLTSGEILRLTIVSVPNTFGHQSEFFVGQYSEEQIRLFSHVGQLLMKCTGLTYTPMLSHAIYHWQQQKEKSLWEKKDFEGLMLLGRIPLISYRIGQVIHLNWAIQSILDEEAKQGKETDVLEIDAGQFGEKKRTVMSAVMIADYLFDTMYSFFAGRLKIRNLKELDFTSPFSQDDNSSFYSELPDDDFDVDLLKNSIWKDVNITSIRKRIYRLSMSGCIRKVRTEGRKTIYHKVT